MSLDWRSDIVLLLILFFTLGVIQALRTFWFAHRTLRRQIDRQRPTLPEIRSLARQRDRPLPFILIFVPARNESAVIHNTLIRLAQLDYPRNRYAVVVIADAREGRLRPRYQGVAGAPLESLPPPRLDLYLGAENDRFRPDDYPFQTHRGCPLACDACASDRANSSAIARPMPPPPPVTRATLPVKSMFIARSPLVTASCPLQCGRTS